MHVGGFSAVEGVFLQFVIQITNGGDPTHGGAVPSHLTIVPK